MGAQDRGHVPGLERLELKPAGAIASLDRHRITSRLWSRETGFPNDLKSRSQMQQAASGHRAAHPLGRPVATGGARVLALNR